MFWAGSSVHDWLLAFAIVTTIGILTSAALRAAGWPWWSRIIILIPLVAVMAKIAGRLLSNTTIILLH